MYGIFKLSASKNIAAKGLYRTLVRQARRPLFYSEWAVPDTPEGRYNMIMIHAFLLLHRLKRDGYATKDISQAVFDLMFEDMDKNLREMGAGDMGVVYRIKDMAKAFYGRIAAYEDGLNRDDLFLEDAIKRNVYRNSPVAHDQNVQLCNYIRREADRLAGQSTGELLNGKLIFSNPLNSVCQ